jgi:hypothetical protein
MDENLYSSPSAEGPEFTTLLMPGDLSASPRWDVWLRSLESQVSTEVPFRDHHLVVCNKHILIYRPCYEAGVFSDGVGAEIDHWKDLWTVNPDRRAVFVHFEADLSVMMPHLNYDDQVKRRLGALLRSKGLADEEARRLADAILEGGGESLLSGGVDRGRIAVEEERGMLAQARVDVFGNALTAGGVDNPAVAVWLVDDYEGVIQAIPEIASFLQGAGERPDGWRERCLRRLEEGSEGRPSSGTEKR